ncbi:5-methylcytosine-specific restriction protein A [Hyphomicrobiales bacterium]|nr:5-methylcytosine-specific restriction protein A [Hyphomicrobiales bacterium]CAH1673367.1 5-methylcytosine-specific restriction protein A [Hyphomicrobiales bacterium]
MPWSPPKHCPRGHPAFTGSRCPHCAADFKARADLRRGSAHERGYDVRWRRARTHFLAHHPLCVVCESEGVIAPATVVDHRVPHRGDQALFWDVTNWQPLCKAHHDRKTATEDGGFGRGRGEGRNSGDVGRGPFGGSRAQSR